jgi:hypothetical protein
MRIHQRELERSLRQLPERPTPPNYETEIITPVTHFKSLFVPGTEEISPTVTISYIVWKWMGDGWIGDIAP